MHEKVSLENTICRLAIQWERAHAEAPSPNDEVRDADSHLASAVQRYRHHLVEEALPVEEEKAEEDS